MISSRTVAVLVILILSGVTLSFGESIYVSHRLENLVPKPEGSRRATNRHAMIPLPEVPFNVDRRILSHNRPAREYDKPYHGPMIDMHVHLKSRFRKQTPLRALGEVIDGIREAGIDLAIVTPTPNEGRRRGGNEKHRLYRKLLKELGEGTIKLMCCGNYIGQWIHNAYYETYTKNSLYSLLQRINMDLDSGLYIGVGELGLYHFNKSGRQMTIRYPPNFEPFVKVVETIANKGYWILLHAETVDPNGVSYEETFFSGIELLYKRIPNLKLIIAHTSTTNPDNVRSMLHQYPNLMIDFKIVKKLKYWWYTEPVNNANRELHEDWANLFESMPKRFMVGTDRKFYRRRMNAKKYIRKNNRLRNILGTLNSNAAQLIAYGNAKRLFSKANP